MIVWSGFLKRIRLLKTNNIKLLECLDPCFFLTMGLLSRVYNLRTNLKDFLSIKTKNILIQNGIIKFISFKKFLNVSVPTMKISNNYNNPIFLKNIFLSYFTFTKKITKKGWVKKIRIFQSKIFFDFKHHPKKKPIQN